jgi:hypothetical protein
MMDIRNGGELMPTEHHSATHSTTRDGGFTTRLLARWLLLGVVIAAVFGLHVLTVDHGDHGDLPVAAADGHSSASFGDTARVATTLAVGQLTSPVDGPVAPSDDGGGWLAGCVLFLVVGSGLLLLLQWVRRRIGDPPPPAGKGVSVAFTRGAAFRPRPRLALGVIRV